VELPLDTTGFLIGTADSNFSGPKELGRLLANNQRCQECIVKQLFRYAEGRREGSADSEFLNQAFLKFKESNFRFKELMILIAGNLATAGRRN
jgi:hypothetical protein